MKTLILVSIVALTALITATPLFKPPAKKASINDVLAKERELMLGSVLAHENQAYLLSKLRGLPQPRALAEFHDHIAQKQAEQKQASTKDF